MTPRIPTAVAAALLLGALTVAALTACTPTEEAAATPAPTAPAPSTPPPAEPVSTPTPTALAAPASCEDMISAGTVDALTDAGWSAEPTEFVIGDVTLDEGLLCFWADYTVGSDHGQLYGWSPIAAADASRAQSALLSSGWTREDGPEGSYFTEDPRYSMGTDDEGYGMTYLFGDGWVKLADTKQSLLLIEWAG